MHPKPRFILEGRVLSIIWRRPWPWGRQAVRMLRLGLAWPPVVFRRMGLARDAADVARQFGRNDRDRA